MISPVDMKDPVGGVTPLDDEGPGDGVVSATAVVEVKSEVDEETPVVVTGVAVAVEEVGEALVIEIDVVGIMSPPS